MAILRSCCLCFSTRTGSFVLGTVGIILGATLLAPMAVFLDYHSYYITQFVASERVGGNYIDDDQVTILLQNMPQLRIRSQRWSSSARCSSLPSLPSTSFLSSLVFFSLQGSLAQGGFLRTFAKMLFGNIFDVFCSSPGTFLCFLGWCSLLGE